MKKFAQSGFSLVEVTLALGVTAFCLLTLMALLPIAVKSNRNSIQQSMAANLATALMADLRQASYNATTTAFTSPLFGISINSTATPPGVSSSANYTIFFREDGGNSTAVTTLSNNQTVPADARTRASFTISTTNATASNTPVKVRILMTWPAQATTNYDGSNTEKKNYTGSYEMITALNLSQ